MAVVLGGAAYVVGGVLLSGRGRKNLADHPHYHMWKELFALVTDGIGLVSGSNRVRGARSSPRNSREGPQKKDKKVKKDKARAQESAAPDHADNNSSKEKKTKKERSSKSSKTSSPGSTGNELTAPLAEAPKDDQPFEKLIGVQPSEHTDAFGRTLLR